MCLCLPDMILLVAKVTNCSSSTAGETRSLGSMGRPRGAVRDVARLVSQGVCLASTCWLHVLLAGSGWYKLWTGPVSSAVHSAGRWGLGHQRAGVSFYKMKTSWGAPAEAADGPAEGANGHTQS